jgi:cell division protein FtsL
MDHINSIALSEGLKNHIANSLRRRSRSYEKMRNPAAALEDYVLYKTYSDSLINEETIKKIQAQELNYEFEQEKLKDSLQFSQEKKEIQLIADNEYSKKKIYFILFIITLLLSSVITVLVKRDFKYKKRLLELENKTLLHEKEQINKAFKKLKESTNAEERIKAKQDILKLKILTEDDWNHFRDKFEMLSPSFLPLLKKTDFKFTKSEERYLIHKKLNVETNGIAGMIGISNDSVLKTQIRKGIIKIHSITMKQ